MQGASSRAEKKASETVEVEVDARTTKQKQAERASASISRDAAAASTPKHVWGDIFQGFQLCLEESRRMTCGCKAPAFGTTGARSAAPAPAHTASQCQDAVAGSGETVHRTPTSPKTASGSYSSPTVPQSATQVPFF